MIGLIGIGDIGAFFSLSHGVADFGESDMSDDSDRLEKILDHADRYQISIFLPQPGMTDHVIQTSGHFRWRRLLGCLFLGIDFLKGTGDKASELVRSKRLGNVIKSADLDRLNRCFYGRISGDHDHVHFGSFVSQCFQEVQATDSRHHQVSDDQVIAFLLVFFQSFFSAQRSINRILIR
ncbi:hypothetical protein ES703_33470 [subsurface metagenome]